jgi:hypothetical protein
MGDTTTTTTEAAPATTHPSTSYRQEGAWQRALVVGPRLFPLTSRDSDTLLAALDCFKRAPDERLVPQQRSAKHLAVFLATGVLEEPMVALRRWREQERERHLAQLAAVAKRAGGASGRLGRLQCFADAMGVAGAVAAGAAFGRGEGV